MQAQFITKPRHGPSISLTPRSCERCAHCAGCSWIISPWPSIFCGHCKRVSNGGGSELRAGIAATGFDDVNEATHADQAHIAPELLQARPSRPAAPREYPPALMLLGLLPLDKPHLCSIATMYASRKGRKWLSAWQRGRFRLVRDRALRRQALEASS